MSSVTRLNQFGFLSITGKDAMKFLQGYATCDLSDVSASMSAIGATCNLQGRMIASFRILGTSDGYLLRLRRELVPVLEEFLAKYIVFSKATMTDLSDEYHCFGVFGKQDGFPEALRACSDHGGNLIIKVGSGERYEIWSPDPGFTLPDADTMTPDEFTAGEIRDGIAWVSGTTTAEFIPQMFRYHEIDAIDFEKGCYLGQEIVARMHYRGKLNRSLHRGSASRDLEPGAPIMDAGGKRIGTVVSVARIDGETLFLAVVASKDNATPDAFLENGQAVTIERVSAA